MALLRLRRAVLLSSSILRDCSFSSISSYSSHLIPSKPLSLTASCLENHSIPEPFQTHFSSFHSSVSCFVGRYDRDPGSKIPEDEILFEGCDYNHWLITMDFPKDPKPSPEEMVETYVQTLAKVVGSVEEAKKRMYACSTTTYNGFQAVMTEEMSEKFRGLPGVVFILPDSYIDPVNKEYGGDKYENGVITPRPPPIQYGRQGRYGDGNRRRYDQPRYERQRPPSAQPQNEHNQQMYQGNPANNEFQGPPAQGYGRSYPPQQNQGPPGDSQQGYYGPPQNMQQGYGRNYGPPQNTQQGYERNYGPPQNDGPPRNYGPPQNYNGPPSGQAGGGFGRPPQDAQQGYTPMNRGNQQWQQQQGNPQTQPGNEPYTPSQGGGTSPQQNYGPYGEERRG